MPDLTIGNFEIDEDSNSDFIVKDSNDNIVFRWDSTNAEWNFENQPVKNLGSLSTDNLTVDSDATINPVSSGSVTVSANSEASLDSVSGGLHTVVLDVEGDGVDNGTVEVKLNHTNSGAALWELKETAGIAWSGDWAIIKLADSL